MHEGAAPWGASWRALAGILTAAGVATVPLALTTAHTAAAGAIVAHSRSSVRDALHDPDLLAVRADDPSTDAAEFGVDGRDETSWMGRPGEEEWRWTAAFSRPVHLGLIRAHFGLSTTNGIPTAFRWEVVKPQGGGRCGAAAPSDDDWLALAGAERAPPASGDTLAQPSRQSWFVDVEACALRLRIDRTNAGPPVLREVQAIESAEDVLRGAHASDDGAYPGFRAKDAIDGTYARRWAGAPGRRRWTLRVDLDEAQRIDRVRVVLGFDATSVPRGGFGRTYAVAWGPVEYVLETSEDGKRFTAVESEPVRPDGSVLPLRRRLVTFAAPRVVRALRLIMTGATGASGLPEQGAVPVVREIAAYRSDDPRPILSSPWILSVNANPAGQSRFTPGGEMTNDAYHAKFLQNRFASLLPVLRSDDRYARALGPRGEPLDAPSRDEAGEALESIEGDDPQLDAQFLGQSSPPPIAVLSGSNDWDYAAETGPDPDHPRRWHWDPLPDARLGGMGQLAPAVRERIAPFVGFCGGAQLLALLEARHGNATSGEDDLKTIDRVLRRTTGQPIRGFAPLLDIERAWPTDPHPSHATIQFVPADPLFADMAGSLGRSTTRALPELHSDAVRPDAFVPGGPLQRFEVVATSAFCGPDVLVASPHDMFRTPGADAWCAPVAEAFRSRDSAWPVIGAQFHAEQRDFATAAPDDPPESVADARLFLAGAYETIVDSYVKFAP
jgi:hypothetical protein